MGLLSVVQGWSLCMCCSVFWISVDDFLEEVGNGTGSFPVWYFEDCSVATTWFCGWVVLCGDV